MRQYVSSYSIMTNENIIYYLMNEDDALKQMKKIISEVTEILGLTSFTVARLLLNHFQWATDTLTDRYWEDPDRLLRTLNLVNANSSSKVVFNLSLSSSSKIEKNSSLKLNSNGLGMCNTCCVDMPLNQLYSLSCRHQHCLKCWQSYLETKIANNVSGKMFTCPSVCNQIVDDEQVIQLLSDNEQLKKCFQRMLINTYVELNRLTRWCPGNTCAVIVQLESNVVDYAQMISCDICKTVFCFRCSNQWHDPIQCSLLKRWDKKNKDETMTCEWVVANTKDCPACHSNIEKNGGCNHMTCRKPGCGHEFCWICLGPWKDHASRTCNIYRDNSKKNQLTARETLARYMHYFTRYQTHNQSLELEDQFSKQVEELLFGIQAEPKSYTEQQAVYKAFDVLKECRRTLKYTYAFAYYLYRNNQGDVFEQNQADLERATEALSGFLEQEIETAVNMSTRLMDKTHYCDQRRKILLDHCKEGYAEHYWAGLDPY